MKKLIPTLSAIILASSFVVAQKLQHKEGPYILKNSDQFKSPKKFFVAEPIGYDNFIVQVNRKDLDAFNFQKFSYDLNITDEKTVDIEGKFSERSEYNRFVKLKDKTYLFAREVFREEEKEGVAALEFSPSTLKFEGNAKQLFKSSAKVASKDIWGFSYYGYQYSNSGPYDMFVSRDRTKFMFVYSLKPIEKKDELNKEIVGIYVYDQDLKKVWGGEYEMPYTEAKMDNLGFTLAENGKVYLLARVREGDGKKESKKDKDKNKKRPDYHFEIITYDGVKSKVQTTKIDLDNYFPTEAYVYETPKHEIAITGFYSKGTDMPVDGAYTIKLDVEKGTFSKLNGGYFEIPEDVIKAYTSEKERKKIAKKEKKDEDFDLGVSNLEINAIYQMSDGTTKIVAEQYYVQVTHYYDNSCKCMRTKYDTYAKNVFVASLTDKGKMEWVKKIPKAQHVANATGFGLSINTMAIGNDIHIFYVDNLKNFRLPETEAPKWHQQGKGGFLTGVTVTAAGVVTKYNLGEIEDYATPFYIRQFTMGGQHNLISSERRKKKNVMYSLEIH